jgi:hypothetical protein
MGTYLTISLITFTASFLDRKDRKGIAKKKMQPFSQRLQEFYRKGKLLQTSFLFFPIIGIPSCCAVNA